MWVRIVQVITQQSPSESPSSSAPGNDPSVAIFWGCVIAFVFLWALVKHLTGMEPGASFVTTIVLVIAAVVGFFWWAENH